MKSVVTLEGVFAIQESYHSSKINISEYWLLGLIPFAHYVCWAVATQLEGEWSFHLTRSRIIPGFSLKMVLDQEPIMRAIKEYLTGRLDFYSNSLFKLHGSQLISLNYVKAVSANSKPQVFLAIENVRILYNYILPYLKSLPFLTSRARPKDLVLGRRAKNFKDFNDFTLICDSVYHKTHPEGLVITPLP